MAFGRKQWLMVSLILFFVLGKFVGGEPQVPCYFIFGDSKEDNGNNNVLLTTAKTNYPPYGIDFPTGPTGRFTNGRTAADILGELLGFTSFIQPFATANNEDILRGVNYASGAAGIRAETGQNVGGRISFDSQLVHHGLTIKKLLVQQRNVTFTKEHLGKCIYTVALGINDYINNYLLKTYPSRYAYTPNQYAKVLIRQYSKQLRTLYTFGARKVAVFGVGNPDCNPSDRAANASSCAKNIAEPFSQRLKPLVDDLNNRLKDAKFTFINYTNIIEEITRSDPGCTRITAWAVLECRRGGSWVIPARSLENGIRCVAEGFMEAEGLRRVLDNLMVAEVEMETLLVVLNYNDVPASGVKVAFEPCCKVLEFSGQCVPYSIPCSNRTEYAYFDNYHPTEIVNVLLAQRTYRASSPLDAYPVDTLYNYGVRNVAIFGLGQIGCTPAELGKYDTNGSACVDTIDDTVRLFNNRLKPLVDDFNKNRPGAKFTLINITNISGGDPSSAGITVITLLVAMQQSQRDCVTVTKLHVVTKVRRVYNASSPLDAYPVDIYTLAHL
ncbi:hypothetical protein RJ639_045071 [Escallonia herrerae]|uniref:Uncharacterized protein n=1 Tax=Escallonia herrerae TaxID=1293975 RepID=A0AA88WBA4_9ASTE|nr:hypothetical protein RJ639_045071 [Escallonia herrerae]